MMPIFETFLAGIKEETSTVRILNAMVRITESGLMQSLRGTAIEGSNDAASIPLKAAV